MNAIPFSSSFRADTFARSLDGLHGLQVKLARDLGISRLVADRPHAPHELHTRTNFQMYDVVLLDPAYGIRPTTPILVFGDAYWALTGTSRKELLYRLGVLELLDLLVTPDDPTEAVEAALDWFNHRYPDRSRHIVDRDVAVRDFLAWRDADRVFEPWFVERFVRFRLVMG